MNYGLYCLHTWINASWSRTPRDSLKPGNSYLLSKGSLALVCRLIFSCTELYVENSCQLRQVLSCWSSQEEDILLGCRVAWAWLTAQGEKMMSPAYKGEYTDLKGQQRDKNKADKHDFLGGRWKCKSGGIRWTELLSTEKTRGSMLCLFLGRQDGTAVMSISLHNEG